MAICLRNGVRVYPVIRGVKFAIEVDDNGDITTYEKLIGQKEVATALIKTYKNTAKSIKSKQDAGQTTT